MLSENGACGTPPPTSAASNLDPSGVKGKVGMLVWCESCKWVGYRGFNCPLDHELEEIGWIEWM